MVFNNSQDESGSESSASGSEQSHSPDRREENSPENRKKTESERSASGSRSGSETPQSGSQSPVSQHSQQNTSIKETETLSQQPPIKSVREDEDTRSQSPNLQIDDHASSVSGSRSGSPHSRSGSAHSPSGSPRSRSNSRSRSGSRSKSGTPSDSKSRSGSPIQKKRRVISSDSDPEQSGIKNKKSRIIDSESENDEKNDSTKVDAQDIFGDADDISASSDDEKRSAEKRRSASRSRTRSRTPDSRSGRSRSRSMSRSRSRSKSQSPAREQDIQPTQREEEIETVPETRIDVEIPRIVTDLGKDIHFVKLPNFLSVDTRPFDTETYEDEIDEEETMDEEGRQRIKLKVSNTIRWREYMNDKGDMIKESNARFVRWSDGSMSLHLGNEIFDVYKQPLHGDHNHMFIRQGTGLQGQAVFRTKLTFRPHSTESFTHKKMTMSLADRSQKTSGIKILTQVGKDPTTDRLYQLKKEEEKLRQAMRSQHRPQPKKKKTDVHNATGGTYPQDEGSDDENAISLSAIKNKYKKGMSGTGTPTARKGNDLKVSAIYSSDDDDGSDFEQRRHKKIDKAKAVRALRDSDSDSDADRAEVTNKKDDTEKSGSESEGSANDSDHNEKSGSGSDNGSQSD